MFVKSGKVKQQVVASLYSGLLLVGVLTLMWAGHWISMIEDEVVTIREIGVALPPPPPPTPPIIQQAPITQSIDLKVQGQGASIQIPELNKQVNMAMPEAPLNVDVSNMDWQPLTVDWKAFSLNELDGVPSLLTQLKIRLPRKLIDRGIKKVVVKMEVVIDEKGQVTLLNIIDNSYPELMREINRFVSGSRFTAPLKEGKASRARFIWPVEIQP